MRWRAICWRAPLPGCNPGSNCSSHPSRMATSRTKLAPLDRWSYRADEGFRNGAGGVGRHRQGVRQDAIERAGPNVRFVVRLDQLGGNAQPIPLAPYVTLE